ncbi:hypothetical protein ASZ90_006737 [hydrocarbon metagenome]|uniref:Uncharacterized protein n=1 Tax=hydrocarbon metagenome TaxID=938273 RepID=A0A0W8FRA9_9ZZZZ
MLAIHKAHQEKFNGFGSILMLSAWGFTMVIASFLFLYIGRLLDGALGTAPNFMVGLFFLGIFLCIMKLYQEATGKKKGV